ncbi:MAG: trypsin-like peptidase domain-containing protein, partial [Thermoleophilia bacterium]|nr:trypsin-like peptidase domain-containing protein [Thermoleophilia bacterium]
MTVNLQLASNCEEGEMRLVNELGEAVRRVAAEAGPSVAGLGRGRGHGSGVVVATDRVLTNAHNLRGEEVTVTFADGRQSRGRVAAADLDADLAVVAVETGAAPAVSWGED